ncbi:MAG: hypothetical protein ACI8VE_002070, partial [Natrialbaceae archaeon]
MQRFVKSDSWHFCSAIGSENARSSTGTASGAVRALLQHDKRVAHVHTLVFLDRHLLDRPALVG